MPIHLAGKWAVFRPASGPECIFPKRNFQALKLQNAEIFAILFSDGVG